MLSSAGNIGYHYHISVCFSILPMWSCQQLTISVFKSVIKLFELKFASSNDVISCPLFMQQRWRQHKKVKLKRKRKISFVSKNVFGVNEGDKKAKSFQTSFLRESERAAKNTVTLKTKKTRGRRKQARLQTFYCLL